MTMFYVLVFAVALALAVLLAILMRRRANQPPGERPIDETYLSSGFEVANPDPGEPIPGEGSWPWFEEPQILRVDIPLIPECDLTYPLIYTEMVQVLSNCDNVAWSVDAKKPTLLAKAREQARRLCLRNSEEDCQGVNELDHSFSHSCFQVDGETFVAVHVIYFFKCSGTAAPAGDGSSGQPESPGEKPLPNCSSQYHYVAHDTSELAGGCSHSDRAAIEQQKTQRLLTAARAHASGFCAQASNELCRIDVEFGHNVTHHCFRATNAGASYHTSTIVYFFGCPMTT